MYDSSDSGIGPPRNLTVRPPARAQGSTANQYRKCN